MDRFLELNEMINVSKFAEKYFERTHEWFAKRVNGYDDNYKTVKFTEENYAHIADSFRDLAKQLNEYADAIDRADNL